MSFCHMDDMIYPDNEKGFIWWYSMVCRAPFYTRMYRYISKFSDMHSKYAVDVAFSIVYYVGVIPPVDLDALSLLQLAIYIVRNNANYFQVATTRFDGKFGCYSVGSCSFFPLCFFHYEAEALIFGDHVFLVPKLFCSAELISWLISQNG